MRVASTYGCSASQRADAVRVVRPTHGPGGDVPGAHLVDATRREAVDHRRADPMGSEQLGPRRDPRLPHGLVIQATAPVEQHDEGKRACALRPVDRHRKEALRRSRAPLLGGPRLKASALPGCQGTRTASLPDDAPVDGRVVVVVAAQAVRSAAPSRLTAANRPPTRHVFAGRLRRIRATRSCGPEAMPSLRVSLAEIRGGATRGSAPQRTAWSAP